MKKYFLLKCFLLIFTFVLAQNSIAQDVDQHQLYINSQLQNAKILFNKNQGREAIRILVSLHLQDPKNAEIDYLLSILYLKVKKDLRGMKKWFQLAQKLKPDYVTPIKLTDSQIKALFEPRRISTVDVNLKILFKEVEKNLGRGKWDEAKNIFKSGSIYYLEAGTDTKNLYNLFGAYIYAHYDSLYYGLKYYSTINFSSLLKKKYKDMYKELQADWDRKYAYFKKEFSDKHNTLNKITSLISQKKYKTTIVFIDLVAPFFVNDIQYIGLINLYKLQSTIELNQLNESRKLCDNLHRFIISRNLPATYMDKLNELDTRLIFKESRIRIGRKIAEIDSMMLKGFVDDGLKRYEALLKQQEMEKLNTDFIYLRLSSVMKNIGQYKEARKYLKEVSPTPGNMNFITALADTINKTEQFEKRWKKEIVEVSGFYANGQLTKAHKKLLPLLISPYLRYGLKAQTYNLMSKIYLGEGKLTWAKHLAYYAGKYTATKNDLFVKKLEEKQKENPLSPELPAQKIAFSLLFKHPQSVQLVLHPLKPGDNYARHKVSDIKTLRVIPGQPGKLYSATSYLVDSGEKTSFDNYLIGMGAMIVSILFINAR